MAAHKAWRVSATALGSGTVLQLDDFNLLLASVNQSSLKAGTAFDNQNAALPPINLFNNIGTIWSISSGLTFPAIAGFIFDIPIDADEYSLKSGANSAVNRMIADWDIEYSDDTATGLDGTWVVFDSKSGETGWADAETRSYPVASGGVTLVPDTDTTAFDSPVNIDVLTNDVGIVGGEVLTVASQPANGTAAVNGDGITIDYTPNGVFTGDDTFTYDVDASGSPALVTVTVTGTAGFSGLVDENLAITSWDVHAFSLDGTVHLITTTTGTIYQIPTTQDIEYIITGLPTINLIWEEGAAVTAGDYMTSPTIGHVWIAQNTGTTKSGSEPTWNLTGTTTDNDITWNYLDELPRPSSQGPIKPGLF